MPPQFERPFVQVFVPAGEIFYCDSQGASQADLKVRLYDLNTMSPTATSAMAT